jgi:hypothetical protein
MLAVFAAPASTAKDGGLRVLIAWGERWGWAKGWKSVGLSSRFAVLIPAARALKAELNRKLTAGH